MKKVLASTAIGVTAFTAGAQWDKARRNRKSSDPVSAEKAPAVESPASESKTRHISAQTRRNAESLAVVSMVFGFLFSLMGVCWWAFLGLLCLDPVVSFVAGDLIALPPIADWLLPKALEPGPGDPSFGVVLMLGGVGSLHTAVALAFYKNGCILLDLH